MKWMRVHWVEEPRITERVRMKKGEVAASGIEVHIEGFSATEENVFLFFQNRTGQSEQKMPDYVEGGKAYASIPASMTALAGPVRLEIRYLNGEEQHVGREVLFYVEGDRMYEDVVEKYESRISALEERVRQLENN